MNEAIRFEDYERLVRLEAWKAYQKLQAWGITAMTLEDVYQEMCVYYTIAKAGFKEEKGFKFSTYLTTIMWRKFTMLYRNLVDEKQNLVSADDFTSDSDEDGDYSFINNVAASGPSVDELAARNLELMDKLNELSPGARGVVRELISPSDELEAAFQAKQAQAEFAASMGVTMRMPEDINMAFIFDFYDISKRGRSSIKKELKEVLSK